MPTFANRLQHAWNVFLGRDAPASRWTEESYYTRPDRTRLKYDTDRTIINSIYTRIAVDCATVEIKHVRRDQNGRFVQVINSHLNECLAIEANKDQSARAFREDVYLSLLDEGAIAILPIDMGMDPKSSNSFDILSMRVGVIKLWKPDSIVAEVYNEATGHRVEVEVPKKVACIVENPFYSIFNEPNSMLQRLKRKLALLDTVDEQNSSGKLDLIIQLPYVVKNEVRKAEAEKRRKEVEMQLVGSKYGVAYTDGTEKITQLNRPVENNLMSQVQYLMDTINAQLGLTPEVFNGTADEKTMLNYNNRTIEPLVSAVVDEMIRKWLTKTARSQGQSIMFFKDPFKLVPVANLAEIADKFTRNAIMTSNEFRAIVGLMPSDDPDADRLRNKNLNESSEEIANNPPVNEDQNSIQ